ncbi:hypothetical protein C5167_041722 [Papaver somniferum]|nr:hypothetical protein C5167_041722 [Papaver somniferum]
MADTRSVIISCLFVCTLFASNTLMCTAKVDLECTRKVEEGGKTIVKTGYLIFVGLCSTLKACDELCSSRTDTSGKTKEGKSGNCFVYPQASPILVCGCCQVP